MSNPDTIVINVVSDVDEIVISPAVGVESVDVNTVSEETNVTIDTTQNIDTVIIEPTVESLQVELAVVDNTTGVLSVNGKTGNVVIDYPDISSSPVNQVKYVHYQSVISNEWLIPHNLGFFPNVTVMDNENRICETDVVYLNTNSVKIVMNVGISGTAYLT